MKEQDFESDYWDLFELTDNLQRVLALAVSLMENNLAEDMDVKHAFMTKAESVLNEYYKDKLPYEQYKKLNKGAK